MSMIKIFNVSLYHDVVKIYSNKMLVTAQYTVLLYSNNVIVFLTNDFEKLLYPLTRSEKTGLKIVIGKPL